ncbi:UDP-N-acetylmuramoyl-tripeptide--D-alanyl-D-alanine ligase [Patescibacteria group bacterium]|nr:UDP-N-acetylmuramoyl-tripeptide--D-alanyl-D-alanine ligase [Patescibacteria group bacterium]MBU1015905.1 UDP-N-acetylmuramoyl-tripeptide--D-alanyl-D-alanine ligase [Patescibacteria group bacterium]MBU1685074.1 UDP-N-acetylmuramoyl-tripeptide--D-alanyl-D-alanine ligase [Patescibacteria group bacterium]MBU1938163.1 UDP-N-acetylmuramoyl-tripeptide--D-alanyl-D-alanine ligase [Patescibacteria group bacterium]
MKAFFRTIIGILLAFKARSYLKQHRVQVIAVTGSVGKTSTKEAIFKVLSSKFDVHSSKKSFNTEFGLSLAVLGEEESGFSSPVAWIRILTRVFFRKKKVCKKIILEMGADKPGDIKKLVKIAPPKIAVVTNVRPVHLGEGQFANLEAIAKEKGTLVRCLPREGMAILNNDDEHVRGMQTAAGKFTYGIHDTAMLMAEDIKAGAKDLKFRATYHEEVGEFTVPVIGEFQVYVLLPAIAVGLQLGMKLGECASALSDFHLPPGRMNPIAGVNRSQIIDSSYNASPTTVATALDLLNQIKASRKIVALGTMNELSEMTQEAHIEAGKKAAQVADLLIAVGHEAPTIKRGALEAGMKEENVFTFFDSEEAGNFLKERLKPGDLVLVKGSQNKVRMEKLMKVIMKEPHKAGQLLCRQGATWQKI